MKGIGAAILLALLLAGCAASSGREISQEEVDSIEVGETTGQELIDRFGAPIMRSKSSNGSEVLVWGYGYSSFAPSKNRSQGFSVTLDAEGRVMDYSMSQTQAPQLH